MAKALLAAYGLALAVFWYGLITVMTSGPGVYPQPLMFLLWLGAVMLGGVAYVALLVICTIIQQRLFAAGLGRSRGWQVIVGGVIFNPALVGWWSPISVLLSVRRARLALTA
jgi:hypothetical protein